MEIIEYSYGQGHPSLPPLAAALGFFDGVHLGHRRLISEVVREAKSEGLTPAVITFPSEEEGIKPGRGRLYSTEARLEIFRSLGVGITVLVSFPSVKELEPKDYLEKVLLGDLNCKSITVGYNHRFGKAGKGDTDTLLSLLKGRARLRILGEETYPGGTLSTTRVKEAIAKGDLSSAKDMLGEDYFIFGRVERGLGLGKKCGFPTVNNCLPKGCPLPRGVYKTRVEVLEKVYTGLTNVGVCPTFGEREEHAETMILDFDSSVYGEWIKVSFVKYLRPERSFSSPSELREQIEKDKEAALSSHE